jgi:hypothetical protein
MLLADLHRHLLEGGALRLDPPDRAPCAVTRALNPIGATGAEHWIVLAATLAAADRVGGTENNRILDEQG